MLPSKHLKLVFARNSFNLFNYSSFIWLRRILNTVFFFSFLFLNVQNHYSKNTFKVRWTAWRKQRFRSCAINISKIVIIFFQRNRRFYYTINFPGTKFNFHVVKTSKAFQYLPCVGRIVKMWIKRWSGKILRKIFKRVFAISQQFLIESTRRDSSKQLNSNKINREEHPLIIIARGGYDLFHFRTCIITG